MQPYPDRLLDEVEEATPEAEVIARETIGLAFLRMVQLLPPRQRAALLLRDIVGLSAAETAEALEQSVASVNSAVQRARVTLGSTEEPPARTVDLSPSEREAVDRFIDAHQRGDYEASIALMHADIRVTMPPEPMLFEGIAQLRGLLEQAYGGTGEPMGTWRLVPLHANRMPGAASYLRAPGDDTFRAFKFDLFDVREGLIAEATTFGATLFEAFGLPLTLDD